MTTPHYLQRPQPAAPRIHHGESEWELVERIDPVAIMYGTGPRLFVSEHNSARRLLRELYRLGAEGVALRGMISSRGALEPASVRALNCYLQHCYAARPWPQRRADGLHRLTWYRMQEAVGLTWRR